MEECWVLAVIGRMYDLPREGPYGMAYFREYYKFDGRSEMFVYNVWSRLRTNDSAESVS